VNLTLFANIPVPDKTCWGMKTWIIIILLALFTLLCAAYLLIPAHIHIKKSIRVEVSQQALRRLLIENSNWVECWNEGSAGQVLFNGYVYSLMDRKYSSLLLSVHQGTDSITMASLNMVEISQGVMQLDLQADLAGSANPLLRFDALKKSQKLAKDFTGLLEKLQTFYSKRENVYGIDIRQELVVDTTLIFMDDSSRGYPSTEFTYSLISRLKEYASAHGAKITGNPMLSVFTDDSIHYLCKVALPLDKKLPPSGGIRYKWMLPHGNILVTEVKGGQTTIDRAFHQLELFIKDYGRDAPAIPFVSLITDRTQVTDTSKWLSRIYYPVMQ